MENMKKSQLVALLENFGHEITEIPLQDFWKTMESLEGTDTKVTWETSYTNSQTDCIEIKTDGCNYYLYASTYNVGWEGDIDGDQFAFKRKVMTKQEMEDLRELMTGPGFGY